MSASTPVPETAKPAVKPRNPVERLLVRGFIGVMLALVAVETWSWWNHKQAGTALLQKTKAVDEAANTSPVTEADVQKIVGGKKPSRSENVRGKANANGASRLDVYSWFTISPVNKREIYVYYGFQGPNDKGAAEVLAVQLSDVVPATTLNDRGAGASPTNMSPRGRGGHPGDGKNDATPADKDEGDKTEAGATDSEDPSGESSPDEKPADEKPGDSPSEKDPQ